MKLILHILRKDLRRHRWEILLYLLACASWAWQVAKPYGWLWQQTRNLVPGVFFGAWFLITIRVVQGESLVGDREFWTTRPYRWTHLLAAKACFLFLCLNFPLLVAEVALLAYAGLGFSLSFLPGLLFLQLCFTFFLTFPAAVLASITESLVQWILTVLGLVVFAMVMSWLPWNKLPATLEGQEMTATVIGAALIVPALAFTLLWQYARRRVWPARLAACAAVLVVPLTVLIASTRTVWSLAYARPDGPTPIHLSIQDDGAGGGRVYIRHTHKFAIDTRIDIPLTVSTTDPDTLINSDGWRVTLNGDGGWQWQSEWINHSFHFGSGSESTSVYFDIPVAIADQLAQKHAKAHVELAFSVYRFGAVHRIDTSGERFSPADGILCRWHGPHAYFFRNEEMVCVAALRLPPVILTETESGDNTCPVEKGKQPLPPGHHAVSVDYGTSMPAEFDPNPVRSFNPIMSQWGPPIDDPANPKDDLQGSFCQGTPLTVRTGNYVGKMNAAFDLGSIGTEKVMVDDTYDSE